MIDEISTGTRTITPPPPPIYAKPPLRSTFHESCVHLPNQHENMGQNLRSNLIEDNNTASMTVNQNQIRQELSSEDIYTLRFSTSVAPPALPANNNERHHEINNQNIDSPILTQQQQSYMYNGCLNRPAFEIISHADLRPATPIKYEKVKGLILENIQFY